MTSKRSWNSLRLLRGELSRSVWMIALYAVSLFFSMPVVTVLSVQQNRERLENQWTNLESVGADLMEVLCQNPFVMAVVLLGAFVSGLAVFSYLHSRTRTDLYHALPIRRQGLFFCQYAVGVIAFAAPYLVMLGASLVIIAVSGFGSLIAYEAVLAAAGLHLLGYLLVYSTAVLAANICGNLIVSVLGAAVLCGILPGLTALVYYFASVCFDTFYSGVGLYEQLLIRMSPVSFYIFSLTESGLSALDLVGACGAAALMTLAALFLHRDRASEAAGHAIAFRWLVPVIKYPILLAVTCVAGIVFQGVGGSRGWLIFGFLCGAVLCHVVLEMIFHADVRGWRRGLPGLGVFAVVFAAMAVLVGYDLIGYDAWLPERDQVESVQLSVNGDIDLLPNDGYLFYSEQFPGGVNRDPNYRGIGSIEYDDPAILDAVLSMAREGAELSAMTDEDRAEHLTANGGFGSGMDVIFHLKNGRSVVRSYNWLTQQTVTDGERTIFESRQFRQQTYPILGMEDLSGMIAFPDVHYSGRMPEQFWAVRKEADLQRLLDAYRAEFDRLTWDGRNSRSPIATLTLATDKGYLVEDLYYQNWEQGALKEFSQMPIYEDFTETLRLLRELVGFEVITEYTVETVEYIEVGYDEYIDEYHGWQWSTRLITDPTELAQELARIVVEEEDLPKYDQYETPTSDAVQTEIWYGDRGGYSMTLHLVDGGHIRAYYAADKVPQWLLDAQQEPQP